MYLIRKELVVRTDFIECAYYYQAKNACSWASKIAKVLGGFMCFESVDDYKTWKNQK